MPLEIAPGQPEPLGLTFKNGRANFALFSAINIPITLCLFWDAQSLEIPLQGPNNGIWHVEVAELPSNASYAYRIGKRLLADPYARAFAKEYKWGDFSIQRSPFLCQCLPAEEFDWQGVPRPQIPLEDLVIYEMHVRGFTNDPSSDSLHPGTYLGIIEKIPYLKKLGINAVELMPVFEFDETHSIILNPRTYQYLPNYWGYSPISFFIPMSRYASHHASVIDEFKTMVRELHRAEIEVLLDVVYNHTSENKDYKVSFRGIDKTSYYMIDKNGNDRDYTGCGNTFQINSPVGKRVILDSLRYWVDEMKVDGFRFDLAAILTRGVNGKSLFDPPILKAIHDAPYLQNIKLIAEPWDAAGQYLVGQFPKWGHWLEWNGQFRDHVRRFIKGTPSEVSPFATALCGSQTPQNQSRSPLSSVNFITAHDGFCLCDLVSYQNKHNLDNGEHNRDGNNQADNWNCGTEGPTADACIKQLRERQMRNFWLALFLSQGIPMILMGDEVGHTRKGNNNPYSQDNEINWFNWKALETNQSMLTFISSLIAFRKRHTVLRRNRFLNAEDIEWHGINVHQPDWSETSRFIAFQLKDDYPLYVAFNADYQKVNVQLPSLSGNQHWRLVVNTADPWEYQNFDAPEKGAVLTASINMLPYSALLAKGYYSR